MSKRQITILVCAAIATIVTAPFLIIGFFRNDGGTPVGTPANLTAVSTTSELTAPATTPTSSASLEATTSAPATTSSATSTQPVEPEPVEETEPEPEPVEETEPEPEPVEETEEDDPPPPPPPPPDPSVTITEGEAGPRTVAEGHGLACGSNSPRCLYVKIDLRNFDPGTYSIECNHDGWEAFGSETWWDFEVTIGDNGSASIGNRCFLNFAKLTGTRGVQVTVRRDGDVIAESNWIM